MSSITNKTITIIVPVYNAQHTLQRLVDSVLAQTITDWRLVLVNDGSSDGSADECNRLTRVDGRISCIHQLNKGVGAARNAGIKAAQSRWLTFVDSDDSIEPDFLANFFPLVDDVNQIVMQGYRRVDSDMRPLNEHVSMKNAEYSGAGFMAKALANDHIYQYGQAVGKMYDKNIIDEHKIRFTEEFSFSEDHLFFLIYMLHVNKIVTRSGEFYNYIMESSGMTLSRRSHPFSQLYARYKSLLLASDNLIETYSIDNRGILEDIDYFAVTGSLVLCLRSLYRNNNDSLTRLRFLKEISSDDKLMKRFNPNGFKGKIVKIILKALEAKASDKIFLRFFR